MTIVEANPTDNHLIPYEDDCGTCTSLKADPQPGLHTWCMSLGRHMLNDHRVSLVYAG